MIDLKFWTHSSNRLLHKSVPTIFLIMSYSAFAAILWQILKSHFEQKLSKTDYPKNIWKEEKCAHGFLGLGYMHFSEKKVEVKRRLESCMSSQSRKSSSFFVQFWPLFSQYSESTKKVQKYWKVESIEIYCKNIESIESMEVITLQSNALSLHFTWRVLWDLIIYRSAIQLNDKSIWS